MKNRYRYYSLFLSLVTITFFGCKKGEEPVPQKTPEQLATEAIAGTSSTTWVIAGGGQVTRNNLSVTNTFQNFEISFSANQSSRTYNTTSGGDLFDNSGNWNFVANDLNKITLAGTKPASGPEISFTRTGNDLILNFSIEPPASGSGEKIPIPSAAIAGSYRFTLKRKP
ncbi:hypothetical protein ACFOUP_11075 [Belliella kenyensis]|uniref:Lipocalin-like domain-containing protein n=1 Tax=Belliella kenyensis TaxID=1472724 RepID=A0ABV8EKS2_9BACT|nr:hypothetical protein [Belliella kenyensis]MCH7403630.1 hypothetical protein [Belliella kenyensis]MDN3602217.1 hypothetical protein [Belliella kenyensis]